MTNRPPRGASLPFVACLLLGACEADVPASATPRTPPDLALPMPPAVLESRAVDLDALEVDVELDGRALEAERVGGVWSVTADVPPGETVRLELTWRERVGDGSLNLATLSEPIGPFGRDTTFAVSADGYVSDPYDRDGDGRSNLDERVAGTDPFVADALGDTPVVEVDVIVPAIPEGGDIPNTDGFRGFVWDDAVSTDVRGEPLAIDNLVLGGSRAEASDGEVPYRWYVMHDRRFLYLYVEFEPEGTQTVHGDSPNFYQDDAVSLFFDGDLSRGERVAGVGSEDDRYFYIRQKVPDGGGPQAAAPLASAPRLPASLTYGATSRGWELRLELTELNVRVGVPFGFEVQIDQDLDGGTREARWAWAYPRRDGAPEPFERSALNGTVLLSD